MIENKKLYNNVYTINNFNKNNIWTSTILNVPSLLECPRSHYFCSTTTRLSVFSSLVLRNTSIMSQLPLLQLSTVVDQRSTPQLYVLCLVYL